MADLFLKLQNFGLELIEPSLKSVKLFLFGLESFFRLFGVRTNIMNRRLWFDLRIICVQVRLAADPLQQLTMMTHWRRGRFLALDFCIGITVLDCVSVDFRRGSHCLDRLAAEPIDA